jgi:hypothetical protein
MLIGVPKLKVKHMVQLVHFWPEKHPKKPQKGSYYFSFRSFFDQKSAYFW